MKKRTKKLLRCLARTDRTGRVKQGSKSLLVVFFRKELLHSYLSSTEPDHPKVTPSRQCATSPNMLTPNLNAPPELSRFAFLIGNWQCEARLKSSGGGWQTFQATWQGRFILDGYAIADDYRMINDTGDLIVFGTNFRSYDAAKRVWNIKWFDALAGTWADLASGDSGGVTTDNSSVTYSFKEPLAAHTYTRATYTNISASHFTWVGHQTADAKTWREFMIVECDRIL